MGSWGMPDKPEHLDMGHQKMSHVELEMLTDRLLNPSSQRKTAGGGRRQMRFATSDHDSIYDTDNQSNSEEHDAFGAWEGEGEGYSAFLSRESRPITRSVTRGSRFSSNLYEDSGSNRRATPFKGTKPMTADELASSIHRLASSVGTRRGKTAGGNDSSHNRGMSANDWRERDSDSRIMPLGQQPMDAQRISDLVIRLTTPKSSHSSRSRDTLPSIRRVNQKPMSALQLATLTDRLNRCSEAVDAQRIPKPNQRRFGIVNSFMWKGWN